MSDGEKQLPEASPLHVGMLIVVAISRPAISRPASWFNCGCTNTLVVLALSNKAIMGIYCGYKIKQTQLFNYSLHERQRWYLGSISVPESDVRRFFDQPLPPM
jgi:hypothetical protein